MATVVLVGACGGPEGSPSAAAEPSVGCVGVPQAPCREAVASVQRSGQARAVQIAVSCTVAVCTETDGQVQIDVLHADGERESLGYGYGTAALAPVPVARPVLTVAPICLGVPFAWCKGMAESAVQDMRGPGVPGGGPRIARITVRCKGVCTLTKGDGETRIDYVDGTDMTSSWGYESMDG